MISLYECLLGFFEHYSENGEFIRGKFRCDIGDNCQPGNQ
jgi:hypothetical protein